MARHTACSTSTRARAAKSPVSAGHEAIMALPDYAPALAMWTNGSNTRGGDMNMDCARHLTIRSE